MIHQCEIHILLLFSTSIINKASLMIPGYSLYLNFDPDSSRSLRYWTFVVWASLYLASTLSAIATQVYFSNTSFRDHVWIKIDLQGHDKLLVGCIYQSPSTAMENSISSLCSLLEELNDFTHLLMYGDFNMKDINWSTMSVNRNTHVEAFIDVVQDLFYFNTYKNQLTIDLALLPACLTSCLPMKLI